MASLGEKALQKLKAPFQSLEYDFREKGVKPAAEALGIPIEATFKSLVIELKPKQFVFLLAPGDRDVSMKTFARILGAKSAELSSEKDAQRLTGYKVGGIGPFGSRTPLPVYIDFTAVEHDIVYFNGGRRGLILGMDPDQLLEAAQAEWVEVVRE